MGITISFGIQKGGVGKTTTTAITSYLLSKEAKVLSVDFDSQGNLTQFLTGRNIYDFTKKTVLEACKEQNPEPYLYSVSETLDLLPAEDLLSTLDQFVYREFKGDPAKVLRLTLDVVKDRYDYILIDLPPNLGILTINGLTASDYAVVMLQSEPFCYDALERYLELLKIIHQERNPDLHLAGILSTMMDSRTSLDAAIVEQAQQDYEDLVFQTIIKRKSRIKEFSLSGIDERTKVDREALEAYELFVEELKSRVI